MEPVFTSRLKAAHFGGVCFWCVGRKLEKEPVFNLDIISNRKRSLYRKAKEPLIKAELKT